MTTRKRRPTTGTRRRRPSTSSSLGALAGAALAGVLTGLLGSLPWWAWVLIVLVGLGVGYVMHARKTRRPAQDGAQPTT